MFLLTLTGWSLSSPFIVDFELLLEDAVLSVVILFFLESFHYLNFFQKQNPAKHNKITPTLTQITITATVPPLFNPE